MSFRLKPVRLVVLLALLLAGGVVVDCAAALMTLAPMKAADNRRVLYTGSTPWDCSPQQTKPTPIPGGDKENIFGRVRNGMAYAW